MGNKIIITGSNGLVGSRIQELLSSSYQFENISRSTGIDITSQEQVLRKFTSSDASFVLHLAAKTNVDDCETDKALGEAGEAWRVNVNGTQNIANACAQTGKKLIYVSTDFVFDGKKQSDEGYTEEDIPNPVNWYATTKYEGEKIVQKMSSPWVIIRIAYPYRAQFERNDFMRAMVHRLQHNQSVQAITDHIFTPTFIDDIAIAVRELITSNRNGIYHVVGSQWLSPYEAAQNIARQFNVDPSLITKTTSEKFFKNRATRPFRLAIKNDKITKLGIKMRIFDEGLAEIGRQLHI